MSNLPQINKNNSPLYKWASAVNDNISQNRTVTSKDFQIRTNSAGTTLSLKSRYKGIYEFPWKGEFDPNAAYRMYDIIRVLPNKVYKDNENNLVPAVPGTWICVYPVPDKRVSDKIWNDGKLNPESYPTFIRYDDVIYCPQYPEPVALPQSAGDDGRYWESFLPLVEFQMCGPDNQAANYFVPAYQSGSAAS